MHFVKFLFWSSIFCVKKKEQAKESTQVLYFAVVRREKAGGAACECN